MLGVGADAPADEVRRAYLRLARQHHPDYHVDDAPAARAASADRMRAVNEAWAVLGDPARRRDYDRARRAADRGRPDPGFIPFDDDDDEPDPRLAPDIPYGPPGHTRARRAVATASPTLLLVAVVVSVLGGILGVPALLGLALVLFVVSLLGFVVLPLLALSEARRHG